MIRLFLDANVYFAGFLSPGGASAHVLQLAHKQKWRLIASKLVLREADRNLRLKTHAKILKAFRRYLQDTKIDIVPAPTEKHLRKYETLIHPKDVPVLAAAVESGADFLLTLDRRHFITQKILQEFRKPKILTPGEFLQEMI